MSGPQLVLPAVDKRTGFTLAELTAIVMEFAVSDYDLAATKVTAVVGFRGQIQKLTITPPIDLPPEAP